MKTKMDLRGEFKNALLLPFVLTVLTSSNKSSYLLISLYK